MPWTAPFVSKGEKIKRYENAQKQGAINIKNVGSNKLVAESGKTLRIKVCFSNNLLKDFKP
ncbi:hypothetical protein BM526_02955 [Alteromonas mediterranea]|nr:hypothetical protein I533_03180 [Alteromonas mediterranea MED64]APE00911.1 hypothetical protein BM526_02955 [Alteromonas mediterranea]|tara:strand:- start:117 stop:299 length:183 start_codon:yes stop_codon:yes gene_type:complete